MDGTFKPEDALADVVAGASPVLVGGAASVVALVTEGKAVTPCRILSIWYFVKRKENVQQRRNKPERIQEQVRPLRR